MIDNSNYCSIKNWTIMRTNHVLLMGSQTGRDVNYIRRTGCQWLSLCERWGQVFQCFAMVCVQWSNILHDMMAWITKSLRTRFIVKSVCFENWLFLIKIEAIYGIKNGFRSVSLVYRLVFVGSKNRPVFSFSILPWWQHHISSKFIHMTNFWSPDEHIGQLYEFSFRRFKTKIQSKLSCSLTSSHLLLERGMPPKVDCLDCLMEVHINRGTT
jgi:hypothetical protein